MGLIIIFIFIFTMLVMVARKGASEDSKKSEIKRQENLKRRKEERERKELFLKENEAKYGAITKMIKPVLGEKNEIIIYEQSEMVIINEQEFSFSKLRSVLCDKIIIEGKQKIVTQKIPLTFDEKLARASSFGQKVLDRNTQLVIKDKDIVKYVLTIQLLDLKKPTITLEFFDLNKANECRTLLENIILLNKEKNGNKVQ